VECPYHFFPDPFSQACKKEMIPLVGCCAERQRKDSASDANLKAVDLKLIASDFVSPCRTASRTRCKGRGDQQTDALIQ
jgi:hypothetical protein